MIDGDDCGVIGGMNGKSKEKCKAIPIRGRGVL
jgi:hypothetical protein